MQSRRRAAQRPVQRPCPARLALRAHEDRDRRARLRRPAARRRLRRGGARGRRPRRRPAQGRGARTPAAATSRTSPDAALAAARRAPAARPPTTPDLASCEAVIDLRADAADQLARARPHLPARRRRPRSPRCSSPGQLVVLESTTYPGTTRERLLPILEESGLAAGTRLPPRLLAGADRPRPHRLHGPHHAEAGRRPHRGLHRARPRALRADLRRGRRPLHARRRPSSRSCSRTSSARSTSPSSTSWPSSATGSASTSGR